MEWEVHNGDKADVDLMLSQPARQVRLWTANSQDRDFRDDKWSSEEIRAKGSNRSASASVSTPEKGYRAYLAEVVLTSPSGHEYKLSTEARVTPDNIKP